MVFLQIAVVEIDKSHSAEKKLTFVKLLQL